VQRGKNQQPSLELAVRSGVALAQSGDPASTPPPPAGDVLLLETGDRLLLETGDAILLE
jgi:hypothetical protein